MGKRSLTAKPGKGFHLAREDVEPKRSFVVYAGEERYPVTAEIEAVGVHEMARLIAG